MKQVKYVVEQFKQLCESHLASDLIALYLRGSFARGDWVSGLSDIDFYLVVRDDIFNEESLRSKFEEKLNFILEKIREMNPLLEISCKYDPESKIWRDKCGSFITGCDSKLLLGRYILSQVPAPNEKELKDYGKKMVVSLCDHWIKTEKLRETPQELEDRINGAQYMVLKIAQNGLFAKGLLRFRKNEIVKSFYEEYPDFQLKNLVNEAYNIRQRWQTIKENRKKMESFLEQALAFPQAFKSYIITHS